MDMYGLAKDISVHTLISTRKILTKNIFISYGKCLGFRRIFGAIPTTNQQKKTEYLLIHTRRIANFCTDPRRFF